MKRKTVVGLMVIIVIVSVSIFAGCVEKEGVTPSPSTTPTPTPTTPPFEKLSFFEEELVGKWSRYHAYDGSYQYYIFTSDRTACYFEIYGSSRKNEEHYSYWKLDPVGNNAFLILHDSTPNNLYGNDIYDFIEDAIFYGGYKNLKMTRSSTFAECIEKEGVTPSPSTTPTPTPTTPPFEKLSFFEEELVGKWSRYHAYDGSYNYFIFNSDRTGCYFEIYGSSRKNEKHYSYWKLDPVGNNAFLILHNTSTPNKLYGNSIYDFIEDAIFLGGYKKLKMTRSSTSREC